MNFFNKLSMGVQIIDKDMRYVFLNESLLKSTGIDLKTHVGRKMEEVYPGFEETEIYKKIQECLESKKAITVLNEFVFEDGRHTFWENSLEKIDEGVIIFSRDITDTKLAEKSIIESNTKLINKSKQLEVVNEKLKRVMGYVAHDLRGPLVNIYSLAELFQLDENKSDQYAEKIKIISERCLNFIYEILSAAAIENGKLVIDPAPMQLDQLIQEKIVFFEPHFNNNNQKVNLSVSNNQFIADEVNIDRVFSNLISNAVKYSPAGSVLNITLNDDGVFTIENEIDHKKVEKSKRKIDIKESVGFGMDIVRSILEKHEADLIIHVENGMYTAKFKLKKA